MVSKFKGAALAVATTMMAAAPAVAAPHSAASLSVAKSVRTGTATSGKNNIAEGTTATYVSIGILAALIVIVLVATGGDGDSDSN